MRQLAPRRIAYETVNGIRFAFAAPEIGFEARVDEALPMPSPPASPNAHVRDAKGSLHLIGGKAVPVVDLYDSRYLATKERTQQIRYALWIAHSIEAAGAENAGLRAEGESTVFGPLEITRAFGESVERQLRDRAGLGEGDIYRVLVRGYQRAVGTLAEDLDDAEKKSAPTDGSA